MQEGGIRQSLTPIMPKIEAVVGREHVTTVAEDVLCYAYDATNRHCRPDAVAFPANTKEVSDILKLANEYRFFVVPRGAGTGRTGGALAVQGGLVLVMTRLNRILRARQKITSQIWRSDLGQIWSIRLSKTTAIASYFEDFANEASPEDGPKLRCENGTLFFAEP